MSLNLARLHRLKTTKDYVQEALLDAIFSGAIGDDVVLTEAGLAEQFGVSRTPVREAIQELEREGVLEAAGARGKRVHKLEQREIQELFWLRRAFEGAIVARLASTHLNREQVEHLEEIVRRQAEVVETNDRRSFLDLDDSFHKALAELTGYPRAIEIMANLRLLFQLTGLKAVNYPNRMAQVLAEHIELVTAIKEADPRRAADAIEGHLRTTEHAVLTYEDDIGDPT